MFAADPGSNNGKLYIIQKAATEMLSVFCTDLSIEHQVTSFIWSEMPIISKILLAHQVIRSGTRTGNTILDRSDFTSLRHQQGQMSQVNYVSRWYTPLAISSHDLSSLAHVWVEVPSNYPTEEDNTIMVH